MDDGLINAGCQIPGGGRGAVEGLAFDGIEDPSFSSAGGEAVRVVQGEVGVRSAPIPSAKCVVTSLPSSSRAEREPGPGRGGRMSSSMQKTEMHTDQRHLLGNPSRGGLRS